MKVIRVDRRLILGLLIVFVLFTMSFASAAQLSAAEIDGNNSISCFDENNVSLSVNNHANYNSVDVLSSDEVYHDSVDDAILSDDDSSFDSDSSSENIKNKSSVNKALTSSDDTIVLDDYEFLIGDEDVPDEPDLIANNTIYINSKNIYEYFEDGILKPWFSGNLIVFSEDMENLGKLSIQASDVVIKGFGSTLKNTVFELDADNITLSDLNLVLDSVYPDNDYAGILVLSDNAILKNLNVNYKVPQDVQAYGIYAEGVEENPIDNLQIINSTIDFEGHNDNAKVYNHALRLESCINATVENNTLMSSLPLKDINFGADGAQLASDLVLTVGIEQCDYLRLVGNTIVSEVNKRPEAYYPSLDSVFIAQSSNSIVANNTISMTDFVTATGMDNYIYGLDIYNLENMTVTGNNISVKTSGGKLAAGTAYPIQVTGPINNVEITYNDLYSFSFGPNIGIYSQNYYGKTGLTILHNKINVTGLAGKEDWALVAGIESQDTSSIIRDNMIEVHSVGNVSEDDHLYGISYLQSTKGDHQYNISQNTVISDGYYSVNLLSSVNSSVADNLLVSTNPNALNSNGFKYGDLSSHEGIEFYDNRVVSAFDYFAQRENIVDNGNVYDYNPSKGSNVSNSVDGNSIFDGKSDGKYSFNPLIPGSQDNLGIHNGEDGWTIPREESSKNEESYQPQPTDSNDDEGKSDNGMSLSQLLENYIKSNGNSTRDDISWEDILSGDERSGDGLNANSSAVSGSSDSQMSNSSDQSPSDSGSDLDMSQSQSKGESVGTSGAVLKKAYKIEEVLNTAKKSSIMPVILVALALLCLFVGYKRKKSPFDK